MAWFWHFLVINGPIHFRRAAQVSRKLFNWSATMSSPVCNPNFQSCPREDHSEKDPTYKGSKTPKTGSQSSPPEKNGSLKQEGNNKYSQNDQDNLFEKAFKRIAEIALQTQAKIFSAKGSISLKDFQKAR